MGSVVVAGGRDEMPGLKPAGPNLSALVVDDYAHTRLLFRVQLEHAGFHVDEAEHTGGAAGKILERKTHYSVVLLDVGLPETDGYTVTDVAKMAKESGAKLVMHTAAELRDEDVPTMRRDYGADEVFPKLANTNIATFLQKEMGLGRITE
ncbi:Sensor histidine kinase RcsC [uncultured archaeon]|nr:Sensor histidine kinase RcsC [uncultured archaeon]